MGKELAEAGPFFCCRAFGRGEPGAAKKEFFKSERFFAAVHTIIADVYLRGGRKGGFYRRARVPKEAVWKLLTGNSNANLW